MRCLSLLWLLAALLTYRAEGSSEVEQPASQNLRGETPKLKREDTSDTSDDSDDSDGSDDSDDNDGKTEHQEWKLMHQEWKLMQQRRIDEVQRTMAISLVVHQVVVCAVALVYACWPRHQPSPGEVVRQREPDFEYGLFAGCCHSWRICCCSFWCLPIRWAETASSPKDNFMNWHGRFLMGFFLFELICVLGKFSGVFLFGAPSTSPPYFTWLGLTLVFKLALLTLVVMHRQHLRRRYGLAHGTCCNECCCDCLTWCFCAPCAAMQEALQVDYVGEAVAIKVEAEVVEKKDAVVAAEVLENPAVI